MVIFFILSQLPPVPWPSGGLQILSREGNLTKSAFLASVHHMCTRTAEHPASCSPMIIMLSDDGWLHIRCLNWWAAHLVNDSESLALLDEWGKWQCQSARPLQPPCCCTNSYSHVYPTGLLFQFYCHSAEVQSNFSH